MKHGNGSKSDGSGSGGMVFRFGLGFVLSLVFMYLAARNVEWGSSWRAVKEARVLWMAGGVGCGLLTFVLFARRWVFLSEKSFRMTMGDAFSYIMIGHLGNTAMPFRLGDVTRGVLTGRAVGVGAVTVLATMFLEKLLDLVVLLMLIVWVAFHVDLPGVVRAAAIVTALTAGGFFIGAGVVVFAPVVLKKRLVVLGERLPKRVFVFLRGVGSRVEAGLKAFRDVRLLSVSLLLTMGGWLSASVGTWCYMRAFDFGLSWNAAVFLLVVVNLGSAIPSSPGFIGVYHYLAVFSLGVWGVARSEAMGYALASHVVNISIVIVGGVVCLWIKGIKYRQLSRLREEEMESEVGV